MPRKPQGGKRIQVLAVAVGDVPGQVVHVVRHEFLGRLVGRETGGLVAAGGPGRDPEGPIAEGTVGDGGECLRGQPVLVSPLCMFRMVERDFA